MDDRICDVVNISQEILQESAEQRLTVLVFAARRLEDSMLVFVRV